MYWKGKMMKNTLKIILSITLVVVVSHQQRPKNKKLYMDGQQFVYQAEDSLRADKWAEEQAQWDVNDGNGQWTKKSKGLLNANNKSDQALSFSRYIIYKCKTPSYE